MSLWYFKTFYVFLYWLYWLLVVWPFITSIFLVELTKNSLFIFFQYKVKKKLGKLIVGLVLSEKPNNSTTPDLLAHRFHRLISKSKERVPRLLISVLLSMISFVNLYFVTIYFSRKILWTKLEKVAEALSRREIELNLEIIFGSNFCSRLERCVTNAPFVV